MCTPACQNNGTCISPATCACPPGYLGDYCEKAVCGRTCQNGGHCLQEGYCWCAVGFYGDACEYNLCNPLCQNGATCIGTNQCQCPPHYSGPLCELKDEPDRPKRSKDNKNNKKVVKKKQSDQGLDVKLRKAEKRLLKIIFRRKDKWEMKPSENITLNRMHNRTETGSLKLDERRFLIKFLTRERKHLTSKDKTKLKRFKNLIRKSKSRQNQKSPRSRRVFDD
ncbi:wnt inhibitory factor 1, partial [Biomphalaria glabrata]